MMHIYCPDAFMAASAAAYLRGVGLQADTIEALAPRSGLQVMLVTCPEEVPDVEVAGDGPLALVEYVAEDFDELCMSLLAASALDTRL